jgi:two-component system sensor histidine kinase KdpD
VTAALIENQLTVSVEDTGSGIPAGDEKKIFEKFYRGHNDKGGSGLGLAICEGIIKAHQGKIWAENRTEGGARFSFTLPQAVSITEGTPHA